ncbi:MULTISPECIES: hypothetical protein [unclassified Burkholderia]|uniref:hypothetical protein n=1 Tax=unclassified Burkholderia TaxID=2613784 RepID=UPI000F5918E8|nr:MULTISPECIES: hypothetical protein [unclassified Burkholderia]QVN13025.1 hypothetical protein JYG37_07635 [Burkholderia sp. LAS2]
MQITISASDVLAWTISIAHLKTVAAVNANRRILRRLYFHVKEGGIQGECLINKNTAAVAALLKIARAARASLHSGSRDWSEESVRWQNDAGRVG